MGKMGAKGALWCSKLQIFDLHEAFFCLVLHITRRLREYCTKIIGPLNGNR